MSKLLQSVLSNKTLFQSIESLYISKSIFEIAAKREKERNKQTKKAAAAAADVELI